MTFHAEGLHGEARRSRSSNCRNQLTVIVHTETQSGFSMYFFVLYPRYHLFLFFCVILSRRDFSCVSVQHGNLELGGTYVRNKTTQGCIEERLHG